MADAPQPVSIQPTKKFNTKSPIFIGICIVVVIAIVIIIYFIYTKSAESTKSSSNTPNKLSDKAPTLPKLNIKLATNDFEINTLINKINKSG
jgi:cell division protein FtsN